MKPELTIHNLPDAAGELTFRVRFSKRFRFRMWLAMKVLRVVARIVPMPCRVEATPAPERAHSTLNPHIFAARCDAPVVPADGHGQKAGDVLKLEPYRCVLRAFHEGGCEAGA